MPNTYVQGYTSQATDYSRKVANTNARRVQARSFPQSQRRPYSIALPMPPHCNSRSQGNSAAEARTAHQALRKVQETLAQKNARMSREAGYRRRKSVLDGSDMGGDEDVGGGALPGFEELEQLEAQLRAQVMTG